MRLLFAIKNDFRFQIRHGFYGAYMIISLIYIVALKLLPLPIRSFIIPIILFTDPSVLGAFFVGGIVLLERGQGLLEPLFVTPLKLTDYILSKVISLTLLANLSSVFIVLATFGVKINYFWLILGVSLTSIFFTLLGLAISVRVKSLNGYLFSSPLYITAFFLPLLDYFGLWSTPLFYLLPGQGTLLLILAAFRQTSIYSLIYSISILLLWIVIASLWAYKSLEKTIIYRTGGKKV